MYKPQFRAPTPLTLLAHAIGVMFATSAYAQTAPADDADKPVVSAASQQAVQDAPAQQAVTSVYVTGSRTIRDGSQAPTPVTVVTAEQLQASSPGTIASSLNMLPAFRGSTTPASGGFAAVGPGSGSFLNLRNLGAQRTLILVDGRRAAPSAINGATDTNVLPQELVKRVDIVTGGASAAYGSDAVAGVVNFVLDTNFRGLKGSVQGGQSSYHDNESGKATLIGGTAFAGDRGRIVGGASYYHANGVDSTAARPFGAATPVVMPDPANPGTTAVIRNVRSTIATSGGLIFGAPPIGFGQSQFGPQGVVQPFNPGTIVNGAQVNGQGSLGYTNLIAGVKSHSGFTHAEFDITPDLTVFGEASLGSVRNRYPQVSSFLLPSFNSPTFILGNPFIPASLQATMFSSGQFGFQIGRFNTDMAQAIADAKNDTTNFVTGFRWKGPDTWRVDGYYQRGKNEQEIKTENNMNFARLFAAADAVTDPATGRPACRVSLTNPGLYPGCVPINLFGSGSVSPEAAAYIQGVSSFTATVKQEVAAVTLKGAPLQLPAGELNVAGGFEYRKMSVSQTSDAISTTPVSPTGLRLVPAAVLGNPGGWQFTNAQPLGGSYDIREAFVEADVPLLANQPFAKELNVNAAARYADYSTSGGVSTYKLGVVWAPTSELRFRAAKSRDIRAPNVTELFPGSVEGQAQVRDVINGVPVVTVFTSQRGNPALEPEKADTKTLGFVYKPSQVQGLSLAVDYFNIDLQGVIGALSPQEVVNQCAAGIASQCALLQWNDPATRKSLARVVMPQQNQSSLTTSGVDTEISYRTKMSKLWSGANGEITLRALATYLDDYTTTAPGSTAMHYAGVVGTSSNPRVTATVSADYRNGPLGMFLQMRHIGAGKFQAGTEWYSPALGDNTVPSVRYLDATATYILSLGQTKVQLFATVNNLLNKQPPLLPFGQFNLTMPTNPSVYDVVGRYVTVGARFQF
jgi:iron complex outermembrane receptor protein